MEASEFSSLLASYGQELLLQMTVIMTLPADGDFLNFFYWRDRDRCYSMVVFCLQSKM